MRGARFRLAPSRRHPTLSRDLCQLLTFVLVGGGTVGVEMASTLAEMSRMALAHDFRHIDPGSAGILLYEAAPRVLPTFPEVLSAKQTELRKRSPRSTGS